MFDYLVHQLYAIIGPQWTHNIRNSTDTTTSSRVRVPVYGCTDTLLFQTDGNRKEPTSQTASPPASQPARQPASQPANQPDHQPASQPARHQASQPASAFNTFVLAIKSAQIRSNDFAPVFVKDVERHPERCAHLPHRILKDVKVSFQINRFL